MAEGMQATETQQKQLEDNGMAAFTSQSCTDAGVTVTAEQSITDNYNSHISFKVEGFQVEDGQQPDFGSISVLVDGKEDSMTASSQEMTECRCGLPMEVLHWTKMET